MHVALDYVWIIKLAGPLQVICKERCFGMESAEHRGQLGGLPLCKTSTGEHGPANRDEVSIWFLTT